MSSRHLLIVAVVAVILAAAPSAVDCTPRTAAEMAAVRISSAVAESPHDAELAADVPARARDGESPLEDRGVQIPCCAYADGLSCLEAGCDWMVAGCDYPPIPTGCYPLVNCSFQGWCPEEHTCTWGYYNPCPGGGCSCAESVVGCVPDIGMGSCRAMYSCPWDLNGNRDVDVVDLLQLIASWGLCEDCPADFDGDGFVGILDLLAMLQNFGPCPGPGCPWDVNGDGVVDSSDLWAVLSNLGPCDDCPEDVNGDGVVDFEDVVAVLTHFGPCP